MKKFICYLAILFCLCSCGNNSETRWNWFTNLDADPANIQTSDAFYQPSEYSFKFNKLRESSGFQADLPSTGNQKILVIPVKFNHSSVCESLSGGCEKVRADIEKAFFGKTEDTGWESVASYYQKSSYNKLQITGKVSDWFQLNLSISQVNSLSEYADPTFYILRNAISWYKTYNNDITDYDSNKDGIIDSVWLVYDADYDKTRTYKILWAYTFWDYQNTASYSSSNPIAFSYAWASYKFMYDGGYKKSGVNLTDAHTYIHETGHLLGLDDYYNYDYDRNAKIINEPDKTARMAGCLDMMDVNIGDHSVYSKMLLNWTIPKVVTGSGLVTIKPFESSGDCIIIPSSWNGSAMDEYIAIELYTPTGLNKKDAGTAYQGVYPKMFTSLGIKVYHIDSRIADFNNYTGYFSSYTDKISSNDSYFSAIVHTNTPSKNSQRGVNANYSLVHLLESNGTNTFKNHGIAGNSTLFKKNSSFLPTTTHKDMFYKSGRFNNGQSINFSFKVIRLTSSSATLKFTML